jgi:hypothetical protein
MTSFPVRELYCPAHFGNTYECALNGEMHQLLSEAKHWGWNRFTDWFDTIDLYDLYARSHKRWNLPEALWHRKFENYSLASELGFQLGLLVTPNHVFADQVMPGNAALQEERYFGQLVCPSTPGVTELVLNNYRNLFEDFRRRGLKLSSLAGAAYDYGGCACADCRPWIVTFGKLYKSIAEVAEEYFGTVEINLWGWWWTPEDHKAFSDWADVEAKGRFSSLAYHLPYGRTAFDPLPKPEGCVDRAFIHASYGESHNRDAYGHYGPAIAPKRLTETVAFLRQKGSDGFLAYTEGDCDEINKAILGGVSSGQYACAREVLQAYADRHFGADAKDWALLMESLGDYPSIDSKDVVERFDALKKNARSSWRLDALRCRIQLAQADRLVQDAGDDWDDNRIAAAKRYIAVKEELYRRVWRLGLQRHIFRFDNPLFFPSWYPEYLSRTGRTPEDTLAEHHEEA